MANQNQQQSVVFRRVGGRIVPIRTGKGPTKGGKQSNKDRANARLQGAAAGGAGAYAISKANPMVTGRTTLYHGTSKANAESILKKGIVPDGSHGIGQMLDEKIAAKQYSYLTKKKSQGRVYAAQASSIAELTKGKGQEDATAAIKRYAGSPQRAIESLKASFGFHNGRVIKASVPLWQDEYKKMRVKNPELLGARNGAEWLAMKKKADPNNFGLEFVTRGQANKVYSALDTPTFKGTFPAHAFKDSKSYKKLSFGEVGQYAKRYKGRFGGGLALGAVGLAGVGWGAQQIYQSFRDK